MNKTTPFGNLEIGDAHCHFFSQRFFETLISQSPQLSREPDAITRAQEMTRWVMPPQNPAALGQVWKEELDQHEITLALLIASVPGDEESVAAAVTAYPDRLAGAFMLDPTRSDAETRAAHAFDELGLRAACLFPAMHQFSVAECEGVRAVVSLSAARPGTAVFVHCGALSVGVRKKLRLPSHFDIRRGNPLELCKLAAEFPAVPFIVPSFGAGLFRETMLLADLCPNVYVDTSSSNKWMNYESSPVDLAMIFKRALAVTGHTRLLFGTDSSFFPRGWNAEIFHAQINALLAAGVSEEQAQAILGGNLRRLLSGAGSQ
jgi:predicted TIM-barrel fold metal-dependent hydrolase